MAENEEAPPATKTAHPWNLGAAVLSLVIIAFVVLVYQESRAGSLKINFGDDVTAELKIEGGSMAVADVLEAILNGEHQRGVAVALLREHSFFSLQDRDLIHRIEEAPGDSDIAEGLRDLLIGLRGPFARERHGFFSVSDPGLVEKLEALDFDDPVSRALRDMYARRSGPFEEQERIVRLSVPGGNRIQSGRGATCKTSKYYREEVRIFDRSRRRSIKVYVGDRFPCERIHASASNFDDLIQLSYEDMRNLIGPSPVQSIENGYARIDFG